MFYLSSRLEQDHGHGQGQGQVRRPPGAGKVDDGSGALLRSDSGSATLSDRNLTGLDLDARPGAVKIAAPRGAGKGRRRFVRVSAQAQTSASW
jgi:hypothetical protein